MMMQHILAFIAGMLAPSLGMAHAAEPTARRPDPVQPGGFSLVQALEAAGYRSGITGKWHMPDNTITQKAAHRYGFDFCTDSPDRSQPYRDTKHFTDDAVRFIRDSRDEPFFLYMPLVAVHGGHVVPPEDRARWKERLQGKDAGIDPDMVASLEYVDLVAGGMKPGSMRYVPEPLVELFDLEADPGERVNLAERHPERVAEMKRLMAAWMEEARAADLSPNPDYDAGRPLFDSRDERLKNASRP